MEENQSLVNRRVNIDPVLIRSKANKKDAEGVAGEGIKASRGLILMIVAVIFALISLKLTARTTLLLPSSNCNRGHLEYKFLVTRIPNRKNQKIPNRFHFA